MKPRGTTKNAPYQKAAGASRTLPAPAFTRASRRANCLGRLELREDLIARLLTGWGRLASLQGRQRRSGWIDDGIALERVRDVGEGVGLGLRVVRELDLLGLDHRVEQEIDEGMCGDRVRRAFQDRPRIDPQLGTFGRHDVLNGRHRRLSLERLEVAVP